MESRISHKIATSTLFQFGGKVLGTLFGLISILLITRYLGVEQFGDYSMVIVFMNIIAIVADLGLYIYLVNEISRSTKEYSDEVLAGNVFTLRLASVVVIWALTPLLVWVLHYKTEILVGVFLISLAIVFQSLVQVLVGVFQKNFDTRHIAIGEIIGRVAQIAFLALVVVFDWGLYGILGAIVLGSVPYFLYVWARANRLIKIRLQIDLLLWRKIIGYTWPVALSIFFNMIYFKLDSFFLYRFRGEYEMGLYGAAYKVLEILISFPAIFAGLITPLLSVAAYQNWDTFRKVIQKGFNVMLSFALPVVVSALILAERVVVLVSGEAYRPAGAALRLLALAVGAIFIGNMFANAIMAIKKQKAMLWGYAATAAVSLVIYLLLIPRLGYMGAAIGTIVSEVMIMVISMIMVYKTSRALPDLKACWSYFLGAAVMGGIYLLLWSWPTLIILPIGGVAYILIVIICGGVDRDFLNAFLRRKEIVNV